MPQTGHSDPTPTGGHSLRIGPMWTRSFRLITLFDTLCNEITTIHFFLPLPATLRLVLRSVKCKKRNSSVSRWSYERDKLPNVVGLFRLDTFGITCNRMEHKFMRLLKENELELISGGVHPPDTPPPKIPPIKIPVPDIPQDIPPPPIEPPKPRMPRPTFGSGIG